MKFAYADPVYLGCGRLYAKNHPEAAAWDDPVMHDQLIGRLLSEYPEGWALSASSPSQFIISGMLENRGLHQVDGDYRVAAWAKPFASYKPGVGLAYTWEPVFVMGGRKIGRDQPTIRDHLICNIALKKGLTGAKPQPFNMWVLDMLNFQPGDTLDDLFPGTGGMGETVGVRSKILTRAQMITELPFNEATP